MVLAALVVTALATLVLAVTTLPLTLVLAALVVTALTTLVLAALVLP